MDLVGSVLSIPVASDHPAQSMLASRQLANHLADRSPHHLHMMRASSTTNKSPNNLSGTVPNSAGGGGSSGSAPGVGSGSHNSVPLTTTQANGRENNSMGTGRPIRFGGTNPQEMNSEDTAIVKRILELEPVNNGNGNTIRHHRSRRRSSSGQHHSTRRSGSSSSGRHQQQRNGGHSRRRSSQQGSDCSNSSNRSRGRSPMSSSGGSSSTLSSERHEVEAWSSTAAVHQHHQPNKNNSASSGGDKAISRYRSSKGAPLSHESKQNDQDEDDDDDPFSMFLKGPSRHAHPAPANGSLRGMYVRPQPTSSNKAVRATSDFDDDDDENPIIQFSAPPPVGGKLQSSSGMTQSNKQQPQDHKSNRPSLVVQQKLPRERSPSQSVELDSVLLTHLAAASPTLPLRAGAARGYSPPLPMVSGGGETVSSNTNTTTIAVGTGRSETGSAHTTSPITPNRNVTATTGGAVGEGQGPGPNNRQASADPNAAIFTIAGHEGHGIASPLLGSGGHINDSTQSDRKATYTGNARLLCAGDDGEIDVYVSPEGLIQRECPKREDDIQFWQLDWSKATCLWASDASSSIVCTIVLFICSGLFLFSWLYEASKNEWLMNEASKTGNKYVHLFVVPTVGHGTLLILTLVFLWMTTLSNPGILRKRVSLPSVRPPEGRARVVEVQGVKVYLPYCPTCNIIRPPRASHCRTCDNCVDRFDHHCGIIGACIGRRNFRLFVSLLFSTCFLCGWTTGWSILMLIPTYEDSSFAIFGILIVVSIISFVCMCFVGSMCFHYIRLVSRNETNREYLKGTSLYHLSEAQRAVVATDGDHAVFPFDQKSCAGNVRESLCPR